MTEIQTSSGSLSSLANRPTPKWYLLVALGAMVVVGLGVSVSPLLSMMLIVAVVGLVTCTFLAIYRPFWLVYGLVLFMPFENFILKFLPGPDQLYVLARFGSEMVVYIGFATVLIRHLTTGKPLRRTPIDLALLLFVGMAGLSILINQAITVDSIANLRALLRYVALYYWIVNLDMDYRHLQRILQLILLTALLQAGIGMLQYLAQGSLDSFLMPRQSAIELGGQSRVFRLTAEHGREYGAIFGTLGDTLYFGLFMLIALAVFLGRVKKITLTTLIGVSVIAAAIAFSYSRAATFGIAMVLFLFAWLRFGARKLIVLSVVLAPLLLVAAGYFLYSAPLQQEYLNPTRHEQSVVENMTGVFSQDYLIKAQRQRLGILLGATPAVLASKPVFGYGPSVNQVINTINATQADIITARLDERNFEDVYWVALLTYYGILGVAAFVILLVSLFASAFKIARSTDSRQVRHAAIATVCVVGLTPFLLFFYRALEFRIFSFYFWLLPALLYSRIATLRDKNTQATPVSLSATVKLMPPESK